MNNQFSEKEIEHEALLNRARKYVADEQAKKQAKVTADNKVSTKNEEKLTTREEIIAEVIPRAQEFVKQAKNETVEKMMDLDESYLRGPGEKEKPKQYTHPEKVSKNLSETVSDVTNKISQKIGDVTDVIKDKSTEYKHVSSELEKNIGDDIGNMLFSFNKGLNNLGEKMSSYVEDHKTLGKDVQNGAKSVVSKTDDTINNGASLFSLDALKSGFNKFDTFLKEQQAKNDEITASRKNDRNMP